MALLADVKLRIQTAQTRATLAVNSELVRLYWDIGRMIDARRKLEGWGSGVIPRLAAELKNEMPKLKGQKRHQCPHSEVSAVSYVPSVEAQAA